MAASALHDLTLADAARAIRTGEVSSVELTTHALDRLEQHSPALNCTAAIYAKDALKGANAADAIRARGGELPALHGVPLAHKDMYYRAGWICENGSKIRKGNIAETTAGAMERLDAAGAIDMARLNMVEFALGITGHNEITGHVRNPWNTDHITGGSSSGSGAAVAARLVYGSLGSDTGGSIRFPAACCGITGIKPTYGRVSRYGAMPLAQSLDCVGPLARTAEDCALLLGAIAGHDDRDPLSSQRAVPDYVGSLEKSVPGLRIAVPVNHFYEPVTDEVRGHVENSVAVLRDAGADIVEVTIPDSMAAANLLNNLIGATEGAAFHSRWLRERPEDYGRTTLVRFLTGAMCPADRYLEALNLRSVVLKDFAEAVFSKADLLHVPLMPMPVPTIEETDFGANKDGFPEFIAATGHCTRCFNYLGLPAASIPCGFTDNGLPVSFQLVGRPFDEATILRMAHAYQRETDWHTQSPDL